MEPEGGPACYVLAPLETVAEAVLDAASKDALNNSCRPTEPEALRNGTAGALDKSNLSEAGLPRRLRDVPPWAGLMTVKPRSSWRAGWPTATTRRRRMCCHQRSRTAAGAQSHSGEFDERRLQENLHQGSDEVCEVRPLKPQRMLKPS